MGQTLRVSSNFHSLFCFSSSSSAVIAVALSTSPVVFVVVRQWQSEQQRDIGWALGCRRMGYCLWREIWNQFPDSKLPQGSQQLRKRGRSNTVRSRGAVLWLEAVATIRILEVSEDVSISMRNEFQISYQFLEFRIVKDLPTLSFGGFLLQHGDNGGCIIIIFWKVSLSHAPYRSQPWKCCRSIWRGWNLFRYLSVLLLNGSDKKVLLFAPLNFDIIIIIMEVTCESVEERDGDRRRRSRRRSLLINIMQTNGNP